MTVSDLRNSSRIRKRTVTVFGHVTSVSLEEAFWDALKQIAAARGLSMNGLVSEVDASRSGNLSSALRVFVLSELLANTSSVAE